MEASKDNGEEKEQVDGGEEELRSSVLEEAVMETVRRQIEADM